MRPERRGPPIRFERREAAPPLLAALAPLVAVVAALGLAAIPLALAGAPILDAYALILKGSLGSAFAIGETLSRATPLVLTGLAVAIAFRARLWNIGAEGQLYLGALAAVAVGSGFFPLDTWPPWTACAVVLLASAFAGGLFMLGPAWLRLRFGVDEVVTTLLLNFVALLFVGMMLEGPMQDPMSLGWPQSAPLLEAAELPRLFARSRVHWGLPLALALALALWFVLRGSVFGFEVRATGEAPAAARFAGIRTGRVLLGVAFLSGGLAGLAGAVEVAGLKGYLTLDLSPGYGYAGIVVATLARLNPLGVVLAAVFVAAVFVGADSMGRALDVSSYTANLIVALSLLCMLLAGLLVRLRPVR
ncbi:MAG: ABC transporter permease [Geminicoccaceae bacterium]|nr:ABC transporter permease [Geminicoccaceae bacterium]